MSEIKFLLKFGEKEHIESFVRDGLFCSNAESFWDIEDNIKIKGQGDRLEASSMLFAQSMTIYDYNSNQQIAKTGMCNGLVRYEPAKQIPVFCMFSVTENDSYTDEFGNEKIALSSKSQAIIKEHFPKADTVAIISNPKRFLSDVETTIGYKIKHDLVHYYYIDKGLTTNTGKNAMDMQYIMYLTQDTPPVIVDGNKQYSFMADNVYRILLCKDIFFKDEQEYRIVLPSEIVSGGKLYPVKYSQKPEIMNLNEFFAKTNCPNV